MNQSIKTIFTWIKKYSWLEYVEQGHFDTLTHIQYDLTWINETLRHDFIGIVKDILR